MFGHRGAKRRNAICKARARHRDHIDIAFNRNHRAFVMHGFARAMMIEEHTAFVKERRIRRVQIFCGHIFFERASAKSNHPPALIMNGKHHTIAKAIITLALVTLDHQPCGNQRLGVVIGEGFLQVLPSARRVADAEFLRHFAGHAAFLQVFDGARRVLQLLTIILRCLKHDLVQIIALFRLVARLFEFGFRHLHAGHLREVFHRIDETQAAVLDQEADRGAVCAAAEAVIELLGLADRERRRFFGMKRTAGDVIRAGALELHIALDHIDDVNAVEQVLNEGLRNQACGARRLTRWLR